MLLSDMIKEIIKENCALNKPLMVDYPSVPRLPSLSKANVSCFCHNVTQSDYQVERAPILNSN